MSNPINGISDLPAHRCALRRGGMALLFDAPQELARFERAPVEA
jgi:hypothetical protein